MQELKPPHLPTGGYTASEAECISSWLRKLAACGALRSRRHECAPITQWTTLCLS